MNKLFEEVGELRKLIIDSNNVMNIYADIDREGSVNRNEGLYEHSKQDLDIESTTRQFTFDIETKLKEPAVPKTTDKFLKMLCDVQRLSSTSWSELRYCETQKLYNHAPGFIDLETNEEVKMYDTLRHHAHDDKACAAITYCILKQKEALQDSVRDILSWAQSTNDITIENFIEKVENLFLRGDFHKISRSYAVSLWASSRNR